MKDDLGSVAAAELKRRVIEACSSPSSSFFEVALAIDQLRAIDRSWARGLIGRVSLSRRRLYDLADVGQFISQFDISESEALSVGVTKLIIIARHAFEHGSLNADDVRDMCNIARETKATRLAQVLDGQNPRDTKAFVFHLNKTDASLLQQMLLEFGAERGPNGGLVGKERALKRLMRNFWSG